MKRVTQRVHNKHGKTKQGVTQRMRCTIRKKTAISLFSGAGGDSLGLERAGYSVVAFAEIDNSARDAHLANLPCSTWLNNNGNGDITKIPDSTFRAYRGHVDLVFAGFPCQGFSMAGKKDDDDPRNTMALQFLRAVKLIKPKYIIGENVARLLIVNGTDSRGKTTPMIELIRRLFLRAGYILSWSVILATDFGIPQLRKRLIIVGKRSDIATSDVQFPWDLIKSQENHEGPSIRKLLRTHLRGAVPIPASFGKSWPDSTWIHTKETNASDYPPHNLLLNLVREKRLRVGRRDTSDGDGGEVVDPDAPSKVITTSYIWMPRLFVGLQDPTGRRWIRTFDNIELARIQGFPDSWKFVGTERQRVRQIGNAVPPAVIQRIATLLH